MTTWHFDGALRRIYEVPDGATYTELDGYRIYDGGTDSPATSTSYVQNDLYSRWVDWQALNDWAEFAFSKSGGNLRPTGEYASLDISLITSMGWRLVLANYPHEAIFYGNLFADSADPVFDNSRITSHGCVARIQGSANLLTFKYSAGQELPAIAAAVLSALNAAQPPIPVDATLINGTKLKGSGIPPTFDEEGNMTDPGDPWLPDI